jgi:hypothetical protein
MIMIPRISWPDGKQFAFTVFDDTDCATVENVGPVYAFLAECGFRTSKSCWVFDDEPERGENPGQTLDDAAYRKWLLDLVARGFHVDFHGASWGDSLRGRTAAALERFAEVFGRYPRITANHTGQTESIYWGNDRLTGWRRLCYDALTRYRNHNKYRGQVEGDERFWGDLCRDKIKYVRNFVYQNVNTLKICPFMPYRDAAKPFVNYWFASSDGADVDRFNRCLSENNMDRLEAEGGACIMYTHFAKGFHVDGKLNPRFQELMVRLSKKNGWYVPCAVLLDHLLSIHGPHEITDAERARLERTWLWEKIRTGST